MRVASDLFKPEDARAISEAVAAAEKKTAGEIVPVVATASDRYERAEDRVGILFASLTVSAAWLTYMGIRPATADWVSGPELTMGLVHVLLLFAVGGFIGVRVARWLPFLKRLMVPRRVMRVRVMKAAELSFAKIGVRSTKDATGILIYVSLFEHMVHVSADKAIGEKVQDSEWKAICDGLIAAMKAGRHREGFIEAVGRAGELLAKHFPVKADDRNELSNELRIVD
jgi:putative membrane protein